ncbi:MAG: Hsp70 family protein [Deltaproteobacteria bacterium]|nr:Hsp70 family protein [Deltaproteobacteria bacterium]
MIGIDFGTSTTEVAVVVDGQPVLLPGPREDRVIPSIVAYPPAGRTIVGSEAEARWRIDLENTIHSVKRIVGRRWFDQEVAEFRSTCGYALERGQNHEILIDCRGGKLTPTTVATTLLERILGTMNLPVDVPVTLGVPPSFGSDQRLALVEIANAAGLERVTTMDEPYLAVLPYLRREEQQKKVAVFDLGGGTFDLAVLDVRGRVHRLLACDGDPYLGGNDIDLGMADWVRSQVLVQKHWDLRSRPESWTALIGVCREAKKRLSVLPQTTISLGLVDPVVADVTVPISRHDLNPTLHEAMGRCFAICDHVLREAGLRASDIDEVVLAGGSTYLPQVREAVATYFGAPPRSELPADHLVAMGAALASAARDSRGR